MYSKEDALANNARIKKITWVLVIALLIGIAGVVPSFIFRVQWLTILISCLCGGFIIFVWNLKLTPLLLYRRFLREISNGLTHDMVAEFVSFSPDITTHDGVASHIFEMSEGPKEKGDDLRMFYWDDSKPAPAIQPGETLHVTSHGSFIVDWERA